MNSNSWTNRARFLMIILSTLVAIRGFIFLVATWDKFGLEMSNNPFLTAKQAFFFALCLIIQYLVLGSILISFCTWRKKGYKNLKSWERSGIINFLTFGFIASPIAALIFGFIMETSSIGFILSLIFAFSIIIVMASIYAIPSELKPRTNHI